ncbi:MAG: PAS domain-containing sensor histidine kinase [Chloroflexi bacterium]|nr:MAG: PAS domain-containing sensor histidine kinase [Chloroflexota bacterium]
MTNNLQTTFQLDAVSADMVDSSPNLIFIVNARTAEFVYVNPAVSEKWGYPREELLNGGTPFTISPPNQPDGTPTNELATQYMMKAMSGEDTDFRWVFRRADGEEFIGLCQIKAYGGSPSLAEQGLIMCTVTDITEDERNRQALEVALRRAEAARIAQQTFIATMSHELRTPINAINGFAGVLMMTTQGTVRQQAETILRNGKRLLDLINSVLDIAKIESEQLPIVMKPHDLREILVSALEPLQSVAKEKNIGLKIEIANNVPQQITIDKDAFIKIVSNLAGNALKFTNEGGVTVTVTCMAENLIIEVSDTGIGIPLHMQSAIFDRFRQVDGSSQREHGGSGLGLYIVRSLCKLLGGNVTVTSVEGQGSTFKAVLPVLKEA